MNNLQTLLDSELKAFVDSLDKILIADMVTIFDKLAAALTTVSGMFRMNYSPAFLAVAGKFRKFNGSLEKTRPNPISIGLVPERAGNIDQILLRFDEVCRLAENNSKGKWSYNHSETHVALDGQSMPFEFYFAKDRDAIEFKLRVHQE